MATLRSIIEWLLDCMIRFFETAISCLAGDTTVRRLQDDLELSHHRISTLSLEVSRLEEHIELLLQELTPSGFEFDA